MKKGGSEMILVYVIIRLDWIRLWSEMCLVRSE